MTKILNVFLMILIPSALHAGTPTLEKILGYQVQNEGISYQVKSGGCTKKDSFRFKIAESEPPRLQLIRVVKDTCERFIPYGVELKWNWKELPLQKVDKFYIGNPIVTLFESK